MGDWLCISSLQDFEGAMLAARKVTAESSTNDCKLLAGRSPTEWMNGWMNRRKDEWMDVGGYSREEGCPSPAFSPFPPTLLRSP